jgi:hypothetical protein
MAAHRGQRSLCVPGMVRVRIAGRLGYRPRPAWWVSFQGFLKILFGVKYFDFIVCLPVF